MNTFLGIMRVERFLGERWFIHFPFTSEYECGVDRTQWQKDYWTSFWDLPAVSYDKMLEKGFEKPYQWNFVQYLWEINVRCLHLCKWSNSSPFFKDGDWRRMPPPDVLRNGQLML